MIHHSLLVVWSMIASYFRGRKLDDLARARHALELTLNF
jgi:hypothetical protein